MQVCCRLSCLFFTLCFATDDLFRERISIMKRRLRVFLCMALLWLAVLPVAQAETSVKAVMDDVVTRFMATMPEEQITKLDDSQILHLLTAEELNILATKYWCFDVDAPAVVSVMRDKKQSVVPFWLEKSGFKKSDLVVTNAEYQYEVWQKNFPAGRVELGINGFYGHRPHYFVCVGPQQSGRKVKLSHFFPDNQTADTMRKGAFVYHDWSDLLLENVPDVLQGQVLLQTIRGRAREAHLIGAFRKSPFPSSPQPDEVVLTWCGDPRTTQAVQWRASKEVKEGILRYKEKGSSGDWNEVSAQCEPLEDRLILNDRYVNHFTATLEELKPATSYVYVVGSPEHWSDESTFTTAPEKTTAFSFAFLTDTHAKESFGQLVEQANTQYPDLAFATITGDLVSTGQYRDEWDALFHPAARFLQQKTLVPVLGNHDSLDGLGAGLYCSLFALPRESVANLDPEHVYHFEYGNALFLVLDVTTDIDANAKWMEEQLAKSKAMWKFALFHFPPYSAGDPEPDVLNKWTPIFDKYHVDFALSGHVHHYLRTHPMKAGNVVASPKDGTIYLINISIQADKVSTDKLPYRANPEVTQSPLCVVFSVDGNKVSVHTHDNTGKVVDSMEVTK